MIKALTVSVGFADLLNLSLATLKQQVDSITVITDSKDKDTKDICQTHNVDCYITDVFYKNGATFNKGKAIEEGLDYIGRDGQILIFDADILFPHGMDLQHHQLHPQVLYGAHRRICNNPNEYDPQKRNSYLIKQEGEVAGFFQLFNGNAEPLKQKPWYGTNWKHAGGCDSVFQAKFHPHNKEKLPIEVIHLGEDGVNWHGRVSLTIDGLRPPNAGENYLKQKEMFALRKRGQNKFEHELIKEGNNGINRKRYNGSNNKL